MLAQIYLCCNLIQVKFFILLWLLLRLPTVVSYTVYCKYTFRILSILYLKDEHLLIASKESPRDLLETI